MAEKLDSSKPKEVEGLAFIFKHILEKLEHFKFFLFYPTLPQSLCLCLCVQVRWQALQALCCAPPSDVLSCESWSGLRRKLCTALTESDPDLSVSSEQTGSD